MLFINLVPFYCFLFVLDHEGVTVEGTAICLDDWKPSGNSPTCMKMFTTKKSWTDARADCMKRDGDLLAETDEAKLKSISELASVIYAWIGLNDRDREGLYLWASTGRRASPHNWGPSQPDNYADNEDCVVAKKNDRNTIDFADNSCENPNHYLCEIAAECSPGKHGGQCNQNCNDQCNGQGNPCEKRTARCTLGCDDGYLGEKCDTRCPAKKYGARCTETCNPTCAGEGYCDNANGRCTEGCTDGYAGDKCEVCADGRHGDDCLANCNENCKGQNNPCNRRTGHCSQGCDDGYIGDACDTQCDSKAYGAKCAETCSPNCAGEGNCDHVNGRCTEGCQDGYIGDNCNMACENNTYGAGCLGSCSLYCEGENDECDFVTGSCIMGCEIGYIGEKCDLACDVGYFGVNCTETCSEFCGGLDNACNNVNGTCTNGCDDEHSGEFCEVAPEEIRMSDADSFGLVLPIVLLLCFALLAALLGTVFFLKNKSDTTKDAEVDHMKTDESHDKRDEVHVQEDSQAPDDADTVLDEDNDSHVTQNEPDAESD